MTQKELENIIPLKNEIKELRASTDAAPTYHGSVKGSDPNFPHLEHNVAVTGLEDDVLEDKERLAEKKLLLKEREDYILNIPDELTRRIFQYKYILGFETWKDVAVKLGGNNTENSVKQAVSRYLRKH